MATFGATSLTLAEITKRQDPNGEPAKIAELLTQTNAVLQDIPWIPSNLPTAHRSTVRTGLPTVTNRRINQGVAASRSTTSQIVDGMALFEAQSWTDVKALEISDNPAEMRRSEGMAFIEAMAQAQAEMLWYGNELDADTEYNGFSVRYASTSGNVADNVLSAGDDNASTNASIWLIGWAPEKIFGIYPKGTVAGLRHKDLGEQAIQTNTNTDDPQLGLAKLVAVGDQWTWDAGLVVKDWRYAVRIPNIEVADLTTLADTQTLTTYGTSILYRMGDAMHRIPSLSACRPSFYMNRTVYAAFDKMVMASANANVYRTQDVNGQMVNTFRGIPMKISDQLLLTEGLVS